MRQRGKYSRIDVTDTVLDKSDPRRPIAGLPILDDSKGYNAESEAFRQAIPYHVPTTWPEAMVLLYHTHIAFDLADKPSPEEFSATETGLNTLFDFMCCEVTEDHEALGRQYQTSANIVSDKPVRHRHCGSLSRGGLATPAVALSVIPSLPRPVLIRVVA